MTEIEFINSLNNLGIIITSHQLEQLEKYYNLLMEWNKKINLTGIVDKNLVYLKHFYDSLTIIKALDLMQVKNLCDIGTGAGFPGLVIKILFPHLEVMLVDSLTKRTIFLEAVIAELNLTNISVVNERAEDFAHKNRDIYDVVTVRAVANLNVLLEYSIPIVKLGGYFIPLKGHATAELQTSKTAIGHLGVEVKEVINFRLPIENSERTIIKFQKLKVTDKKYPRLYKDILNKPL